MDFTVTRDLAIPLDRIGTLAHPALRWLLQLNSNSTKPTPTRVPTETVGWRAPDVLYLGRSDVGRRRYSRGGRQILPQEAGGFPSVEKQVILIVDDEERVLFVLQNALMKLEDGFEVMTAHTAEDALRKLDDVACDLVITDLIMPDMDGLEFTRRVRAREKSPTVIWMTAYGCHSFAADVDELGVYRCVEKPLEIGQIRELAREALSHRDGSEG